VAIAVGQLIREAIGKLRLKLLDLTNRNRLLNFKLTASSNKFVRVVDEIPGHLYSRLTGETASSAKLYFAALPQPPEDQVDANDTGIVFPRIAAAAGQVTSHDGNQATAELNEKPAEFSPARLNLAQWARSNGIEASYDLPEAGASGRWEAWRRSDSDSSASRSTCQKNG
jgi:hypothetical protein